MNIYDLDLLLLPTLMAKAIRAGIKLIIFQYLQWLASVSEILCWVPGCRSGMGLRYLNPGPPLSRAGSVSCSHHVCSPWEVILKSVNTEKNWLHEARQSSPFLGATLHCRQNAHSCHCKEVDANNYELSIPVIITVPRQKQSQGSNNVREILLVKFEEQVPVVTRGIPPAFHCTQSRLSQI